jgi:hypothetical protein
LRNTIHGKIPMDGTRELSKKWLTAKSTGQGVDIPRHDPETSKSQGSGAGEYVNGSIALGQTKPYYV